MKKILGLCLVVCSISWASGAQGRDFGSLYTQVSYAPIHTKVYADADGEAQTGGAYTRHTIDWYGEVGIWKDKSTFLWNITGQKHDFKGREQHGLGHAYFALHHQYLNSVVQLGVGAGVQFASLYENKGYSDLSLSADENGYLLSHYLHHDKFDVNLTWLFQDNKEALQYELRLPLPTWRALYTTLVVRGHQAFHNVYDDSDAIPLAYDTNTGYVAPGLELFYSLNSKWHVVGAFYGGAFLKNIYAFPGLKIGVAYSIP